MFGIARVGTRLLGGALVGVCAALAASVAVALAVTDGSRRPSPLTGLLPNGRQLSPAGTRVMLGNLPTGGAVTADGRYLWTVSAGMGNNDVRIVDTVRNRVCQVLPVPGASGGIALDTAHLLAYVSGLAASLWIPTQFRLPGARGDDVLVFSWSGSCGNARLVRVITVPSQAGAPAPQASPPNPNGTRVSWPERLAVSADGSRLLVPLNLADSAAVIDLRHGDQIRYVTLGSGSYPFAAAILPDGRTGLVTNEANGTMSALDMASGTRLANIQVGSALSHPEGVAVDRTGTRAYVALANSDQVTVVDLRTRRAARTVSLASRFGLGTIPVAVALDPSGGRLFVGESGADAVAAIRLPGRGTPVRLNWTLIGRVPTAEQPEAVLTTAARGRRTSELIWIAARGADTGPLPNGPNPTQPDDPIFWAFHPVPPPKYDIFDGPVPYGAVVLRGEAGLMALPSSARIAELTATADGELHPVGGQLAPSDTPLRAGGPIKHVFFVVRENRSYDQMLGDIKRGDGDPKLLVFNKRVTPNMHSLVNRFPLLDNVLADSDASIQGTTGPALPAFRTSCPATGSRTMAAASARAISARMSYPGRRVARCSIRPSASTARISTTERRSSD